MQLHEICQEEPRNTADRQWIVTEGKRFCAGAWIMELIDLGITQHALKALNVDEHGLDDMDNRILADDH